MGRTAPPAPSLSHVALGVGRGEGPLAARLLTAMGLQVTDNGPSLQGDPWFTALVDPEGYDGGMSQLGFFVVPVSDEQLRLEAEVRSAVDGSGAVDAFRAERARKPDSTSHVAVHLPFEALERAVVALRSDPELAGRVTVAALRPESPAPGIAGLIEASEVFRDAPTVRYLTTGVQAFVTTDVVSTGLLCLGQSFELNHDAG